MSAEKYACCRHCIWLPTTDERFCSPEVQEAGGHEMACGADGNCKRRKPAAIARRGGDRL